MFNERRRHVRTKPTPELPAHAVVALDGLMNERLAIIDISVGGMALATARVGNETTASLQLHLAGHGEHRIKVETRWTAGNTVGVAFVDLSEDTSHAIRRYVGELLERGSAA